MRTSLINKLKKLKNPAKAKILQGFFKTGKGQYGEGDMFWGITVPEQRRVAKEYIEISLEELHELVMNPVHEVRLTSFIVLTEQYKRTVKQKDEKKMKQIYDFYITHAKSANNWDLVDLTAPIISGHYIFSNPEKRKILQKLAASKNIWERRIAILSTFYFIRQKEFALTFDISNTLLKDKQDLIHKAAGWMLREVGKRDEKALKAYLAERYNTMPRTMLRYAIERFSREERGRYLLRG